MEEVNEAMTNIAKARELIKQVHDYCIYKDNLDAMMNDAIGLLDKTLALLSKV